jgi:hypothetical protein
VAAAAASAAAADTAMEVCGCWSTCMYRAQCSVARDSLLTRPFEDVRMSAVFQTINSLT